MEERRQVHRSRTYLGGQIAFNNRFSTFDCLLRNVSPNGAKIAFPSTVAVPRDFDVVIPVKGESRRAQLMWRTETEIGVAFVQLESRAVVSIEAARKIRNLESERNELQRRVAQLSEPA